MNILSFRKIHRTYGFVCAMSAMWIGNTEIVRSANYNSVAVKYLSPFDDCLAVDERLELLVLWLNI